MKTTRILPNEKFGAMDPVSRNLRTSHSAYREMLTPGVVVLALATVAGFVVLYALIGAAGTDAVLDWPHRLAFWGVAAVVCFPVCYSKSVLALYMAGSRPFPQILLAVSVTTAISALPATALVYTLDRILLPPHPEHDLAALYLWVFAPMLLGSVFVVYLVSGTSKRARVADAAAEGAAAQRMEPPSAVASEIPSTADLPVDGATPQSPFLGRLSAQPDPDLIYLKMNDHYVEAVTSAGSEIILMRFADAVTELAGLGMQVHRSYWVSYRHVVKLARDRHRRYVELAGAPRIPVSRTYLSAVRLAVEGLTAGGDIRPQGWTSGVTRDPERAETGGIRSQTSKAPGPATPPQRQRTSEERVALPNDLIHAEAQRSTAADSKQNPPGSSPQ